MRLVDANVLLYAVNADAHHHDASRSWLDRGLAGGDSVGFAWLALLAFVRISTKDGLFPRPLDAMDALTQVRDWLAAPGAHIVQPTESHIRSLEQLVAQTGTGGNLVNDAHLAALALERRADIVSYDRDFARFAGVRCYRPEELLALG